MGGAALTKETMDLYCHNYSVVLHDFKCEHGGTAFKAGEVVDLLEHDSEEAADTPSGNLPVGSITDERRAYVRLQAPLPALTKAEAELVESRGGVSVLPSCNHRKLFFLQSKKTPEGEGTGAGEAAKEAISSEAAATFLSVPKIDWWREDSPLDPSGVLVRIPRVFKLSEARSFSAERSSSREILLAAAGEEVEVLSAPRTMVAGSSKIVRIKGRVISNGREGWFSMFEKETLMTE